MARLIDADKLREKSFVDVDSGEPFIGLQELDEAPTVDAVEVVRCKDCIHRVIGTWAKCTGRKPDDFCSDGVKRFHD